jgi:hypothetical protein
MMKDKTNNDYSSVEAMTALPVGCVWISVLDRLPKGGKEVLAFINVEEYYPDEASRMRLINKVVKNMNTENTIVNVGNNQAVKLFNAVDDIESEIRKTVYGIAVINNDDEGKEYLSVELRREGRLSQIYHGDCATHWMPLPAPPNV